MERIVAENGVVFYRSEIIPCKHGFSTRLGGVSQLSHTKSLNLGLDRGDSPETVYKNLALLSEALELECEGIISVSQIHSAIVRYVDKENRGEGLFKEEKLRCDGYVTDSEDISLGVRTADCVPILFYAPASEGFGGAVAAVHAGWRGTACGIAAEAVRRLCDIGADASKIRAAIGPSIGSCCYSVKKDFYESFLSLAGDELTERFVTPVSDGVWIADLKGINREILHKCGVSYENIDVCGECTCCNSEEFFSHRYSKGIRGTMLSVINRSHRKKGT